MQTPDWYYQCLRAMSPGEVAWRMPSSWRVRADRWLVGRRQQMRVIVVNMPFRPDLPSISATGTEDYREFLQEMRALQCEYGFTWLDYQAALPLADENFRDVDHLNAQGARQLSTRLGEDLVRLMASVEEPPLSGDPKRSALLDPGSAHKVGGSGMP